MKQSVFNSTFTREGEAGQQGVAFNSMTGALSRLDAAGLAALKSPDGADEDLVETLVEGGFLVPDGADEFAGLEQRFLKDMNTTSFLMLNIAPTMQCNLRCAYCYEDHEAVRITPEVEDAIVRFVERRFARFAFKELDILWYGGEPTLEIDAMEHLSKRLMAWASDNGVAYYATMISNASLVDEEMASRLASMGIEFVMPTLDGCSSCHDKRRVQVDGSGSFDQTLAGIAAMGDAGIHVAANSNLDKTALDDFHELSQTVSAIPNASVEPAHLRNYGGWADSPCSKATNADLLSRKEFAEVLFDLYAEQEPTAQSIYETLRSRRMFCQGKSASYFVIDPEGNVCRCDGRMRDPEFVLFNLLDDDYGLEWPETRTLAERNKRCRNCAVAPLCLGQCEWEWSMFKDNCSPVKYNLGSYVWLLHDRMMEGVDSSDIPSVCVLIPPRDIDAEYSEEFSIPHERWI